MRWKPLGWPAAKPHCVSLEEFALRVGADSVLPSAFQSSMTASSMAGLLCFAVVVSPRELLQVLPPDPRFFQTPADPAHPEGRAQGDGMMPCLKNR